MPFIEEILLTPSYGWKDSTGNLIKPSKKELFKEFFERLNVFKNRKNWLAIASWSSVILLFPFILIFILYHFSFTLILVGFLYGMIVMGTHGTIWYHRYSTHQSYVFKNKFWRIITQNLVPKMIPEEVYVVSHHVHHAKSDMPGDPYNASAGFLYCFLADVNHQLIAHDLSEENYYRVAGFLKHTGVKCNTYSQYQKWGSVMNPLYTYAGMILNLCFWFTAFYLMGGMVLVCTLFGGAFFWAVGVRTFNYKGHGKGKDMRISGVDFSENDQSVNQYWPGLVAGEWHNNHHLFPGSARAGFFKTSNRFSLVLYLLLISHRRSYLFTNSKSKFIKQYYNPYKEKLKSEKLKVKEKELEEVI